MSHAFLSYRHESPDHKARVAALAARLRGESIEVVLDQDFATSHPGGPPEGWNVWSADQAKDCGKALLVISAGYARCFEGKETAPAGFGAALEARIFYNQLYDLKWITDRHRVVLLDAHEAVFIPTEIKHLTHFRPLDSDDSFRDLCGWIKGAPVVPAAAPASLVWPGEDAAFDPKLADREDEWPAIRHTLSGCGARVLLFEGASDSGKTGLLTQAAAYSRSRGLATAYADFKEGLSSPDDVLDSLLVTLHGLLPETVRATGAARKGALGRDLRKLREPLVVVLDTWEKTNDRLELRDWLEHGLLPQAVDVPGLVFLIGGQTVPDRVKGRWGSLAQHFPLGPLKEHHWRPWFVRHCPEMLDHMPTFLLLSGGGTPGPMMKLIATCKTNSRFAL